eukprot:TRINITY_DN4967_c0_g1_i1.p1 TRINITY_DN4967_c0_g1~~TRINITY_DN4967_c0_g1_i1.p1  ORF type:complete len:504 (+),score=133.71 TRINITY_DN4967_c0_g1_i1:103-1512(+)
MSGEFMVWLHDGDREAVALTLQAMATVGDASAAAQEKLGRDTRPLLSYAGQELRDPAAQLADLGIGSQAALHVVPGLVITLYKESPGGELLGDIHLQSDATVLQILQSEVVAQLRSLETDVQLFLKREPPPAAAAADGGAPAGPPVPVPCMPPSAGWMHTVEAQILRKGPTLTEQGVTNGAKIILHEEPMIRIVRGRPYVPVHAPLTLQGSVAAPRETMRARAAALWAEQAGEEAGSVAAFAALTLRLMAHGAPAALLDACMAAGRDEVQHAEYCKEIAQSLGATPGQFPSSVLPPHNLEVSCSFGDLAARAVLEGAVGEAVSAASAALAAQSAHCPRIRELQATIAADEARHAALAWATACWAAARPGTPGAEARKALGALAASLEEKHSGGAQVPVSAEDQELLGYGAVEGGVKDQIVRSTQEHFVLPALRALAAGGDMPGCAGGKDAVTQALAAVAAETSALIART